MSITYNYQIAVAVIRSSSICIRGTRQKWKENVIGFEDGAGVQIQVLTILSEFQNVAVQSVFVL